MNQPQHRIVFYHPCHFIYNDWVLKNAVLVTIKLENVHTSENIALELKKVQADWSITEFNATTDNARHMKSWECNALAVRDTESTL